MQFAVITNRISWVVFKTSIRVTVFVNILPCIIQNLGIIWNSFFFDKSLSVCIRYLSDILEEVKTIDKSENTDVVFGRLETLITVIEQL